MRTYKSFSSIDEDLRKPFNEFFNPTKKYNNIDKETKQKVYDGVQKADSMLKGSNINLTEKDKGDFYASFAKQSLWKGIDDFKVKEARQEGYSALNASKAKRTNIQKEIEEYAKLHKGKNEEIRQAPKSLIKPENTNQIIGKNAEIKPKPKSTLDNISTALTVASVIPGLDTLTNLAQIPVDLARGEYLSAVYDLIGVLPVVGEFADTAKLGLVAGSAIKTAGLMGAIGKVDNIADTIKIADKTTDTVKAGQTALKAATEGAELADDIGDAAKTVTKARKAREISHPVLNAKRVGSANKLDAHHNFSNIIDNYARDAKKFILEDGAELYQIEGSLDGKNGIFEWILDKEKGVTHRRFKQNAKITGKPN